MEFFDLNNDNLEEITFDNNNQLPSINEEFNDYTFEVNEMKGGSLNETKLPGEELLENPEDKQEPPKDDTSNKIEVELIENDQVKQEEVTQQKTAKPEQPIDTDTDTDTNPPQTGNKSYDLESKNKKESESVLSEFKVQPENNDVELLSDNNDTGDENLLVKMNVDDKETGGPIIVENELETDILDTSSFLKKLQEKIGLEESQESQESEDNDDHSILNMNKMLTKEYTQYIFDIQKYFKEMKSKKNKDFEFFINKEGHYIKKNTETNYITTIIPPKYINVKQTLVDNKKLINQLLYDINILKRKMLMSNKSGLSKISSKFNDKIKELSNKMKENKELSIFLDYVLNTEKINKTKERLIEQKSKQLSNFREIKDILNKSESVDKQTKYEAIISYLNTNNKILEGHRNTNRYLNVNESDFTITTESVTTSTKKKIDDKSKESLGLLKDTSKSKSKQIKSEFDSEQPVDEVESDEDKEQSEAEADEDQKQPNKEAKKKEFYSKFVKGDVIEGTFEKPQEKESQKKAATDYEELNLDDDIESYAPQFEQGTGYPNIEEEDEDSEIDENYKFNSEKKMTSQLKRELEKDREIDQQIPFDDPTVKAETVEAEKTAQDVDDTGKLTNQQIKKISRKLNKPIEEDANIKVIEINQDLEFKPKKCDDKTTKRSNIKTTNMAAGKKRRRKNIDPELKNCIFPFKTVKGRGKNKKETFHNECISDDLARMCATERKEDCTIDKYAYCEK